MRGLRSLTARLSLMFGVIMIAIWSLVSLLLTHALDHHFARQDADNLRGKLQLARSLLSGYTDTGSQDWAALNRELDRMLLGHSGHYLLITDPQGRVLVDTHPPGASQPGSGRMVGLSEADLGSMDSWQEDNRGYRSITERQQVDSRPGAGYPPYFMVRAALDTSYHQHFISDIKKGLYWFTAGIALISLFLGWFASRVGLTPLRELASVSENVTANKLSQRLALDHAPAELHASIQSFNAMLDRLETSFHRLSEFSSDIAHELRTPVNSLMMQTQVALSKERSADDYREVLYSNLEAAERLARMISEMLFLAKSEHGLLRVQGEELELAKELDELVEFFEPLAFEQQLHIIRRGNARLLGDRAMLQRAFSNLLSNAIRYTPTGASIRIDIEEDNAGVSVGVANPGTRIPPAELSRLFDRFYRADSARQQVTEGTGLGLSITRAIVEAHGGSLSVHSDNRETRFTARFPGVGKNKGMQ
ncbi:heavy metal sensor histidine kinase [Zobellella aerophila]|uniref:Sensor protein n=1 Tax=Zobellella aerophila TaxID=870480 RepID=A0ABP6V8C8_9GAMM